MIPPKPAPDAEYCPICGKWIVPERIILTGEMWFQHDPNKVHTIDDWRAMLVGIQ